MISGVDLLPEAQDDITNAYIWYENARKGLGDEFIESIRDCLRRMIEYPSAHPAVGKGVRKSRPKRFPYQIYFRERRGIVIVYAVHHDSRDPNEWMKRV
jgi:plasmid stabilization system protein ParE